MPDNGAVLKARAKRRLRCVEKSVKKREMSPPVALQSRGPVTENIREPETAKNLDLSDQKAPSFDDPVGKLRGALDIFKLYRDIVPSQRARKYEHEHLLPAYPDLKWPPLEEVALPEDRALFADPDYTNLFAAAEKVEHLTPTFGTVLHGVQLADLTDAQKDELALLVSYRGVVFFRGQSSLDIKKQLDLGRYYGPLHSHPTTSVPKGWEQDPDLLNVHVIYADNTKITHSSFPQSHQWHADVTYEEQPPSYTFLKLLDGPYTGGDTLWSSSYGVYDGLSSSLQKYLEDHTAIHTSEDQANDTLRAGFPVRRPAITTEHPLVRVHPVTKYKSVYINSGFTRQITGVPKAESDAILAYLNSQIATNVSHTVRWKWEKDDVAVWDNRSTTHAASFAFNPAFRHAVRVCARAERPKFKAEGGISQLEWLEKELGLQLYKKNGTGGSYND